MSAADLRRLPAVERVLQHPRVREAAEQGELPRPVLAEAAREVLAGIREEVRAGRRDVPDLDAVADRVLDRARARTAARLVPVINATGVVLHTNLGRAPLAAEARRALEAAAGYCNVEFRLATGERGHRHEVVEALLRELTGAEAACVVNNNAAAVLLGLAALARGREVVVSRGELVEIGGSFRIPEVMEQSGAVLREVGTTNKTHLGDYERAIGPETALLLKVHTSNYRILGFTASVPAAELVGLARRNGLAVMEDLGSGCLVDLARAGIDPEPTVGEALAAGVDLVTFSGDKLLGGPQAGILVGRRQAVEACARHPLMRALRPDKLTLAALEATLALYRDPVRVWERVPALRMLSAPVSELEPRAEHLAAAIRARLGGAAEVRVAADVSRVGGGALPLAEIPTRVVEIRPAGGGTAELEERLRQGRPPVVGRVRDGALVLDPRTVAPDQEEALVEAVAEAAKRLGG
ncbi:MAG: L-seryl-tRNA(Sec) selenium transferase [Candidatus Dadabacteria bacterium]|nr:MAG: L-seryl-tRNA(Sec) selenium transferase [Candidatus Dadabacteria bacterium]